MYRRQHTALKRCLLGVSCLPEIPVLRRIGSLTPTLPAHPDSISGDLGLEMGLSMYQLQGSLPSSRNSRPNKQLERECLSHPSEAWIQFPALYQSEHGASRLSSQHMERGGKRITEPGLTAPSCPAWMCETLSLKKGLERWLSSEQY